MNIEDLSLPQLIDHQKAVMSLILERSMERRRDLLAERARIDAELASYGEPEPTHKAPGPRKGTKIEPKYRNPEDAKQTWTGRGLKPKWLQKAIDAGHTLGDFAVHATNGAA